MIGLKCIRENKINVRLGGHSVIVSLEKDYFLILRPMYFFRMRRTFLFDFLGGRYERFC